MSLKIVVDLPEPFGATNSRVNGGCNRSGWSFFDGLSWLSKALTESTSFGVSSIFIAVYLSVYSRKIWVDSPQHITVGVAVVPVVLRVLFLLRRWLLFGWLVSSSGR